MSTLTFNNLNTHMKEPPFRVLTKSYSGSQYKTYWQGTSIFLAMYKLVAAKNLGWYDVRLEWKE